MPRLLRRTAPSPSVEQLARPGCLIRQYSSRSSPEELAKPKARRRHSVNSTQSESCIDDDDLGDCQTNKSSLKQSESGGSESNQRRAHSPFQNLSFLRRCSTAESLNSLTSIHSPNSMHNVVDSELKNMKTSFARSVASRFGNFSKRLRLKREPIFANKSLLLKQ